MTTTKTILSRILFGIYLLAILFLCFASDGNLPHMTKTILGIPTDKIAHFIMFAPFAFFFYLSFDHPTNKKKTVWTSVRFVLISIMLGAMVAAGTELIQGMIPYRSLDWNDFLADMSSILPSSLLVLYIDLTHKK